jgi:phosphoribosylformylglycinamidine synthase
MKARVTITLKPGLLDVQGKTIKSALETLGFSGIGDVRMGKYVEVDLAPRASAAARREVERMCKKLLANPVIERYHVEVQG